MSSVDFQAVENYYKIATNLEKKLKLLDVEKPLQKSAVFEKKYLTAFLGRGKISLDSKSKEGGIMEIETARGRLAIKAFCDLFDASARLGRIYIADKQTRKDEIEAIGKLIDELKSCQLLLLGVINEQ